MILSTLKNPLTIQGDTLGSPVRIGLPETGRALGLRFRCGGREEILCGPSRERIIRWVPPLALAEEYPDRTQIPVTLVLEAYRGENLAETRETGLLLGLPAQVRPTVSLTVTEGDGGFVRGGSALAEVTAAGSLGAEIVCCAVTCGPLSGRGQRLLFDLPQAGDIPVMARVTDSRGRQAEASVMIHAAERETANAAPLLDICPGERAIGIGCRTGQGNALSLGLEVRMNGSRLSGLPEPAHAADALSLGGAEKRFLGFRRLWENPLPDQAFPAQVLPVSGALLLIEAAETAGGTGRVWEIVGSGGSIRVLSGGSLSSRGVTQTEAGLRVGDASGGNDRAVPLSIYALKGDGVT